MRKRPSRRLGAAWVRPKDGRPRSQVRPRCAAVRSGHRQTISRCSCWRTGQTNTGAPACLHQILCTTTRPLCRSQPLPALQNVQPGGPASTTPNNSAKCLIARSLASQPLSSPKQPTSFLLGAFSFLGSRISRFSASGGIVRVPAQVQQPAPQPAARRQHDRSCAHVYLAAGRHVRGLPGSGVPARCGAA